MSYSLLDSPQVEPVVKLINDPSFCRFAKDDHAQVQRYFYEVINLSMKKGVLKDFKTITSLTLGRLAGSEVRWPCPVQPFTTDTVRWKKLRSR